jgi:hypothetical protein
MSEPIPEIDRWADRALNATDPESLAAVLAVLADIEEAGRREVAAKRKANRKAKRLAYMWRVIESFANVSPYAVSYVPPRD